MFKRILFLPTFNKMYPYLFYQHHSPRKPPPALCAPCWGHAFTWGSNGLLHWQLLLWEHEIAFTRGGMRGKERPGMPGQCGRRAAPGLCCHVPGRGPVRSWGPLRVGKSEKYFPKLVFGQLQPTLSNDTKQTGIWILQFFNPNRCLPTPDLLSPS